MRKLFIFIAALALLSQTAFAQTVKYNQYGILIRYLMFSRLLKKMVWHFQV